MSRRLAALWPAIVLVFPAALAAVTTSNPSPADGADGVPAASQLCVTVEDSAGQPLDVSFRVRELGATPEADFTLIALPDTQYYSQLFPEIFNAQIDWIVAEREARRIVFVTHEGDVVQVGDNPAEWYRANVAMSRLEDPATTGLDDGIPYGISVGNHDQAPNNEAGTPEAPGETTIHFNQSFGVERYQDRGYWGGNFGDNNDNSYQLFEAGGMEFLIVHHEFDDDELALAPDVLDWTDALLKAYPERRAILTSHSLLCTGTDCPSTLWAEFSNHGQLTYDALKDNENLFLMICGHAGGSSQQPRRTDIFDGNAIHTFLADYQRGENCPFRCGNGYLRIVTFRPASDDIHVQTYSPWLDAYKSGPCSDGNECHEFTLPYDMNGGIHFRDLGTAAAVPSGLTACVDWSGGLPGDEFEWYVETTDGAGIVDESARYSFTTGGLCGTPADCDDGDPCTDDDCSGGLCVRAPLADCCVEVADCDDGNPCTTESCDANICSSVDNTRLCDDGDGCTEQDVCGAGSCLGQPRDCEDGNLCTVESCTIDGCVSGFAPTLGCCVADADCDDGDPCTVDSCDGGDCSSVPDADCCQASAACDDGDACTVDICEVDLNAKALRLDGLREYVAIGRPNALGEVLGMTAMEFTIELWFKWDGSGELARTDQYFNNQDVDGVVAYPLVTKGRGDRDDHVARNVNYFLGIDRFGVLAADFENHFYGPDPSANNAVRGTTPIATDVWYHVAAVYDGSCWQLYLDGQPETDGTNCPGTDPAYLTAHGGAIGSSIDHNGGAQGYFGGWIDELRVWSRGLSATELAAQRFSRVESGYGLMASLSFDGSDGVLLSDSSEQPNAAVLVGGQLVDAEIPLGSDSCVHPSPERVAGLAPGVVTDLIWRAQQGMLFDVVSGALTSLAVDSGVAGALCLAAGLTEPAYDDARPDPAPGQGYYFLVRSRGGCQSSDYGEGREFPVDCE